MEGSRAARHGERLPPTGRGAKGVEDSTRRAYGGGAPPGLSHCACGSSCEAVEKASRRSSKDLWDEDNEVGVNDKKKGAVGDAELFGQ